MPRVLLKLTGELIPNSSNGVDTSKVKNLAEQVKVLVQKDYIINIVIGAGNFYRGAQQNPKASLSIQAGHYTGMIATLMNAIIIQDIFSSTGIDSVILSAIECPQAAYSISNQNINKAIKSKKIIIFAGGTGSPFFTTDTNAVVRALQSNSSVIWKGTKVDGIYTQDPKKHSDAKLIKNITYTEVISKNLKIMDQTAFSLAKEHSLPIRIFNIFEPNALLKASEDKSFGSVIN